MSLIITFILRLYRKLKSGIGFNIAIIVTVLVNACFTKLLVNKDVLSDTITVVSIVFGFVIAAICNLFGRAVTSEMALRISPDDPGITQLQELRGNFAQLLTCCLILMFSSFAGLMDFGGLQLSPEFCWIAFCTSGIYLFLLFFVLYALLANSIILLNLLINETDIAGKKNKQ